jgi:hypothetical protein
MFARSRPRREEQERKPARDLKLRDLLPGSEGLGSGIMYNIDGEYKAHAVRAWPICRKNLAVLTGVPVTPTNTR